MPGHVPCVGRRLRYRRQPRRRAGGVRPRDRPDRLHAVHLNDSKNPLGAHKDRHAPIGEGCIGFEALSAVTKHPALRDMPFFLETPHDAPARMGRGDLLVARGVGSLAHRLGEATRWVQASCGARRAGAGVVGVVRRAPGSYRIRIGCVNGCRRAGRMVY